MHASPHITDLLPRRRRKYRVLMAGACLLLVGLMVAVTSETIFWAMAAMLAVGIFTAYWYAISWPAVAAVVCVLGIALSTPRFQMGPPPPGHRQLCAGNLKQISLAIASYYTAHGQYPPPYTTNAEGQPLLSWRVLILPYLERRDLYEQFHLDEPWDSPHNLPLAHRMPETYRCPSVLPGRTTPYLAIVGNKTVWRPGGGVTHTDMQEFSLGTALLIEDPLSAVVWTEPTDLSLATDQWRIERLLRLPKEQGHRGGLHVAMTNGEVMFLPRDSTTEDELNWLFSGARADILRRLKAGP